MPGVNGKHVRSPQRRSSERCPRRRVTPGRSGGGGRRTPQRQKPGEQERDTEQRVEAVERALSILDAFTAERPSLSLAELAERTGFYPSTILRLASSLARFGYMHRGAGRSVPARSDAVAAWLAVSPSIQPHGLRPAGARAAGRANRGDGGVLCSRGRQAHLPLPAAHAAPRPASSRRRRRATPRCRRERACADGLHRWIWTNLREGPRRGPLCLDRRARSGDRCHRRASVRAQP